MTMTTLVTDSSIPNYNKIKKAIVDECNASPKYSLLSQTTYFFEEGVEKQAYLTKADIHDRIVLMNISDKVVSTSQPVLSVSNWASMVKYSEGAKWEPIGKPDEHWFSTTRYPEQPSLVSQATFYQKFWFSSSDTKPQLNAFGRDIVKYDQATDSFKTKTLSDWDRVSVVSSNIMTTGVVEEVGYAVESAIMIAQAAYPTTAIPTDMLLVFTDGMDKFVLVGAETYRAWNTKETYVIGFRGVFQQISEIEFNTHKVTL
jgi:hypothetical protein